MPNPVAEVVARLRKAADNIERARMSGIVENLAGWEQRAVREAAECIAHLNAERLSRESDTGVPEGWQLVPKEPTREMLKAGAWAQHSQACDGGHNIVGCEAAEVCWPAMLSAAPPPPTVSTQGWQDGALKDIAHERLRQMSVEGWTPEHDDGHASGEMSRAAACYALAAAVGDAERSVMDQFGSSGTPHEVKRAWPWDWKWWKPRSRRRDLVKAGALIVAEIERLDRANGAPPAQAQPDLSTLTRERDQAREALAPFAKVLDAMEHDNQLCEEEIDSVLAGTGIVPSDLRRARSVLHPEKEEKA